MESRMTRPPAGKEMQEIEEDTCVRAFRYYDTDNSGSLDKHEVLALTKSLWYADLLAPLRC